MKNLYDADGKVVGIIHDPNSNYCLSTSTCMPVLGTYIDYPALQRQSSDNGVRYEWPVPVPPTPTRIAKITSWLFQTQDNPIALGSVFE